MHDRQPTPSRLPSRRASAALAAAMLGIGVAVGAAIGPAPAASLAGNTLAGRLPALIAALESGRSSSPQRSAPEAAPEASSEPRRRRRRHHRAAAAPAASTIPTGGERETPAPQRTSGASTPKAPKLPAISSAWLIELAGGTLEGALANAAAAPYLDGQIAPQGTVLTAWSAVQGGALAADAVLASATSPGAGSPPPLLHTIVQPPCPEGDSQCAAETPGQLTAADQFLQATLAQITNTPAYREHGLVVITFATVAIAAQGGLPAGAASATLTSQPPGGVVLLSPFVRASGRSSASFDPTSPVRSLEALLR